MATGIAIGVRGACAAAYEFHNIYRGVLVAGTHAVTSSFRLIGREDPSAFTANTGSITPDDIVGGRWQLWADIDHPTTLAFIRSQFTLFEMPQTLSKDWLQHIYINGVDRTGDSADIFGSSGTPPNCSADWEWTNVANKFGFVNAGNYPLVIVHRSL